MHRGARSIRAGDFVAPTNGRPSSPTPLELARLLPLLERALPHSRDDSRRTLVNRARIARIGRQGLIFKQGDRMPLVLIVDGHAAFQRTTVEGRLLIVGVANPGALIGLTSMDKLTRKYVCAAEPITDAHEMSSWVNMPVARIV